jgi:hypothetical protein
MAWDDLDDAPKENVLLCAKCERIEEFELPKCSACTKRFCDFCVFRVGGKEYCSRECGIRYFFGGGDDDDVTEE